MAAGFVIAFGLSACSSAGSSSPAADAKPTCVATPAKPPTTPATYTPSGTMGAVAVAGGVLAPYSDAAEDPAVGCAVPIIAGQNFDGEAIQIGGATDKPTLVIAAAHWCPHCNNELPKVVEWVDSTDIEKKVDMIVVSTGFAKNSENYPPKPWLRQKMGWTGSVLADDAEGDAADALGVTSYPMFVLIDTNGKVVKRLSGEQKITDVQSLVDGVVSGSGS